MAVGLKIGEKIRDRRCGHTKAKGRADYDPALLEKTGDNHLISRFSNRRYKYFP